MKFLTLVTLSVVLAGCAGSFAGRAPETRTRLLPYAQSRAYTLAQHTLAQMGTQITAMDGRSALAGTVHGAVMLHVQVQAQGESTLLTVTGSIPAGKLTLGSFDELNEFFTRFAALEQAHAR